MMFKTRLPNKFSKVKNYFNNEGMVQGFQLYILVNCTVEH